MTQLSLQESPDPGSRDLASNLIQRLTEPAASVTEFEQRFQARLLAALLLAFIILGSVSVLAQLVTVSGFERILQVLVAGLATLIIAYILSRTRWFRVGVVIAIAVPLVSSFLNAAIDPAQNISITFALVSVLLASVLFSWRQTLALVLFILVVATLLPLFLAHLTLAEVAGPISLIAICSGLILILTRYRSALEEGRRSALATSENRFRMLVDQSPYSTVIYSPDGRPQMFNRSAVRMWNMTSQDLDIIRTTYNVLKDRQLEAKGALPYIRRSFSGEVSSVPPIKYELQHIDNSGAATPDERWIQARCYPVKDDNGRVREVVLIHEDITQRREAQEKINRRNRELGLLNRVISAATSTLSMSGVLHLVCRELSAAFAVPMVVAALLSDDGEEATMVAAHLPEQSPEVVGTRFPTGPFRRMPAYDFVMQQRKPLVVPDLHQVKELATVANMISRLGAVTLLILPLSDRETTVGALVLASDEPREFSERHVELAESVASSVSQALHNTRLYQEVQRHNVELEERVAERTKELATANERLKELARVKDAFISNVSHELRTPLTNIKLFHDLWTLKPDDPGNYMATLQRETDRLDHIVESLLHISRLDQGPPPMKLSTVDLAALAELHVSDRQIMAERRKIALSFHKKTRLPLVRCDPMQVGQVMGILLTNALNYTPEGGSVTMYTETRQRGSQAWACFMVGDTGPGIQPDEQSRLFERFFRGSAGRQSGAPGTGLGLAIAKEIVDRHQGHIDVFSEGVPGRGTILTVCLPADQRS